MIGAISSDVRKHNNLKVTKRQAGALSKYAAFLLIYLAFMVPILTSTVTFVSWQQVEDLHNARVALDLLIGHPHFPRYLVARPGLQLADIYGDVGFSLYIGQFAFGSVSLMYLMLRGKPIILIFFACSAIALVHIFMNGRGAISWFGWMSLLFIMFSENQRLSFPKLALLFFALLCTSVSSGTFSVAFATTLIFFISKLKTSAAVKVIPLIFGIVYVFWGLFMEGVLRNLSYYSYGTRNPVLNMLRHGFGDVILNHPVLIALVSIMIYALLLGAWLGLKNKPQVREFITIVGPLAGGVFGYTTMSLALPSIILVFFKRMGNVETSRATVQTR